MEDNKNREQDVLATAFREKLANHSLPVDPVVWEGIQAKLTATSGGSAELKSSAGTGSAGSTHLKRWLIPVVAAASLALLISIGGGYWLSDEPTRNEQLAATEMVGAEVTSNTHESQQLNSEPEGRQTVHSAQPETYSQAIAGNSITVASVVVESKIKEAVVPVETDEKSIDQAELLALEQKDEMNEQAQHSERKQEPEAVTEKKLIDKIASRDDWTELLPERKRRKPMLAAGMSSGMTGSNPALPGTSFDAMYETFIDQSDRPLRAPAALAPADFKTRDYLPSLSAGLKVRLPMSDTWSFETGLQYSYLQTKLSDASWSGYWADIQLHYLGLPVGITATLSRSSNWELYWSGGVMAEKGLHSLYREYRDWGAAVFTTTASSRIEGWQWSLFTALGVAYHLDDHLMLYLDPQLAYFFENDQPLSIRTEMPLMVGLSAGLRFAF